MVTGYTHCETTTEVIFNLLMRTDILAHEQWNTKAKKIQE